MYAEALRRDPPRPLRPGPYLFLSRAYARAGKTDAAIEAAETALEVAERQRVERKSNRIRDAKGAAIFYQNALDNLKAVTYYFDEELRLDVMLMLDKYTEAIPSQEILRQVPAALIVSQRAAENKALAKRTRRRKSTIRWAALRDRLKDAARRYYSMQLLNAPRETLSGLMLAKMGILCCDTGPRATTQLDRCAAIVLQKAIDAGYEGDPEDPNSLADFWCCFARVNYRIWCRDGIRAERIHLAKSSWAWDKALNHVKIACDVGCWRESATVLISLGDYPRAAQTLGVLVRSFPSYPMLQAVQLEAAMILFQMKRYDQAVVYARLSLQTNRLPAPMTHADVMFFMARIYDKLAIEADEARDAQREQRREEREAEKERIRLDKLENPEDYPDDEIGEKDSDEDSDDEESEESDSEDLGEEKRNIAYRSRTKVFEHFKDIQRVDENFEYDDWIVDPDTYKGFAKTAIDAGKYLMAVDLYKDAIHFTTIDDDSEGGGDDSDSR